MNFALAKALFTKLIRCSENCENNARYISYSRGYFSFIDLQEQGMIFHGGSVAPPHPIASDSQFRGKHCLKRSDNLIARAIVAAYPRPDAFSERLERSAGRVRGPESSIPASRVMAVPIPFS
jgi:hypothetical protein